jgi:hypothetical protein
MQLLLSYSCWVREERKFKHLGLWYMAPALVEEFASWNSLMKRACIYIYTLLPFRRKPCWGFAVCKSSLNWRGSRNFEQNYRTISRPQFHLSLLGSLASLRTYRHLAAKVGTSKGGGKQWQTTPKNFPRMQCARSIPVTWLGSGSCQPGL